MKKIKLWVFECVEQKTVYGKNDVWNRQTDLMDGRTEKRERQTDRHTHRQKEIRLR